MTRARKAFPPKVPHASAGAPGVDSTSGLVCTDRTCEKRRGAPAKPRSDWRAPLGPTRLWQGWGQVSGLPRARSAQEAATGGRDQPPRIPPLHRSVSNTGWFFFFFKSSLKYPPRTLHDGSQLLGRGRRRFSTVVVNAIEIESSRRGASPSRRRAARLIRNARGAGLRGAHRALATRPRTVRARSSGPRGVASNRPLGQQLPRRVTRFWGDATRSKAHALSIPLLEIRHKEMYRWPSDLSKIMFNTAFFMRKKCKEPDV